MRRGGATEAGACGGLSLAVSVFDIGVLRLVIQCLVSQLPGKCCSCGRNVFEMDATSKTPM